MSGALSADWIAGRRWFRSKGRPIARVTEHDRAPLAGGAALVIAEVSYADGGAPHRYLVPLVGVREPLDGEGAWSAMVAAIAARVELPAARGRFRCAPTAALDDLLPSAHRAEEGLTERRLGVEQSNTSVVLGERLILKLYRLLEPGQNPDVEVSAFLTEVGFLDTPAVAGWVAYEPDEGEACAAAMLQELVPADGDAWAAMRHALETDPGTATAMAGRVGGVTARLHRALGSRPDHPTFPARVAGGAETAAWRAAAERQLADAVTALSGEEHARLVELAPRVTARFADTFGAAGGTARVSRIHGDYHLGQLLARSDGGFSVIDFEGEPARPLDERRRVASPLRDVAGMLRSLDYAARTAGASPAWLEEGRSAFLAAYGALDAAAQRLLDAFELEKACYEVRYEAMNRPAWLWLPLGAIERLVGPDRRPSARLRR